MASRTINVSEVFESSRFTPYQVMVCLLCFLVTFIDGFDLTIIGVALPKVADFLHSKPSALGLALSAGQFGPLVGAIVLGSLADRWGRKWMLFWSAIIFGVFTFLTAFITSVEELALYRFIAGIGLGGAVPNALAFGSEYAPSQRRSTIVASMYAGMPAGATMGALAAVFLLPYYDWQSLFLLGGVVPVLIGLVVAVMLPESIEFMVRKGKNKAKVLKIARKVAPQLAIDDTVEFQATGGKLPGVPVKHLFTEGRAIITIFLWLALIGSLYSLWILTSWAPTLLKKTGATVQQYSLAFACLHFGAFIATVTIGRMMDKFNPYRVLQIGFVLGGLSLAAFGVSAGGSFIIVAILSVLCGGLINGSNGCLLAVATLAYPPSIRGSGIGWAYAVAKIGAMLAPAVGGILLGWNWTVAAICGIQSLVALAVAALVLALQGRVTSAAQARETEPLKAGAGGIANASFHQHYPLKVQYDQSNPKPTFEDWKAAGYITSEGKVANLCFVGHYVGDYDSPSWFYKAMPVFFNDPRRGETPLPWAPVPILSDRVPQAMVYVYENASPNDYFIAGDSGAGYLNPRALTVRPETGLPSGLAAWTEHCIRYYSRWGMTISGFVLDGSGGASTEEEWAAYKQFSPDGLGTHFDPGIAVHQGIGACREIDLDGSPEQAAADIARRARGVNEGPVFQWRRSILKSPTWYAEVADALATSQPEARAVVVDPYTFFGLIRYHLEHKGN